MKLTDATASESGADLIRSILRAVGARAVQQVEPLFPGDTEPDLATLFNVTLHPSTPAQRAIDALRGNPSIQYAHTPQARKPKEPNDS